MAARWSCWLAAELAAVVLLSGCAGLGDEEPAESAGAPPARGGAGARRVPGGRHPGPQRAHRRGALPQLRRAGLDLDLVPERPHGLRLDLQGRALDPRRPHAAAADDVRHPEPQAERLPHDGRARLRRLQGRVGVGALPARDLPGEAHAPAGRPAAARGRRAPRALPPVGRRHPEALRPRLLLPPRAHAARAVDLPAIGTSEPAGGQRPDPGDQPDGRVPRPRPLGPQPPAPPAPGGLHGPSARGAARPAEAHRAAGAGAPDRRGGPRLLVPDRGREQAPARPHERRGDRAGSVLHQGPGADEGRRGPVARPEHRPGRDDRGPARHGGVLEAGRGLRVLAGHEGAARAGGRHARLQADGPDRAARAPSPAGGMATALGAALRHRGPERGPVRRPVGPRVPDRAAPGAARPAGGHAARAPAGRRRRLAGRGRDSPTPRCTRTCRPTARTSPRA